MNSAKTFAEYLIEQNVINETTLVDTLIEQQRDQPSVLEIVREQNLLDPKQLVQILSLQSRQGIDFQSACVHLNLWNDSLATALIQESQRRHRPLGEILIANKVMDLKALTAVLDAFLVECRVEESTEVASGIPTAAVGAFSMNADFCDQFNSAAYRKLQHSVELASGQPFDREEFIMIGLQALNVAHRLVGAAQFAKLSDVQEYLTAFETTLQELTRDPGGTTGEMATHWALTVGAKLEQMWRDRNKLFEAAE